MKWNFRKQPVDQHRLINLNNFHVDTDIYCSLLANLWINTDNVSIKVHTLLIFMVLYVIWKISISGFHKAQALQVGFYRLMDQTY